MYMYTNVFVSALDALSLEDGDLWKRDISICMNSCQITGTGT